MNYFLKSFWIIALPLVLFSSCKKDNDLHRTDTITSGSKWGIQIGSSVSDVYRQLQQLGTEKEFNSVSIVGQHSFSKPENLKDRLAFYHAITLQSPDPVIHRILILFSEDTVNAIQIGGGMLNEINQWPQDVTHEKAIRKGDSIAILYHKLAALYQKPPYNDYKLILPEKTLAKDFDPKMTNYDKWGFVFEEAVKPGKSGRTSVSLFFKSGKLIKIRYYYDVLKVYN